MHRSMSPHAFTGARRLSLGERRARHLATAALVLAAIAAPATPAVAQTIAGKQLFVPLPPCRAVRTVITPAGALATGETRAFAVLGPGTDFDPQGGSAIGCGVPDLGGVTAVFANVVAQNASGAGNLKVWAGDGAEPVASAINYQVLSPNLNIANGIIVPVRTTEPAGADINVKASASVQVIVDLLGYFTPLSLHDGPGSGLDADTIDGADAPAASPSGFDPTAPPRANLASAAHDVADVAGKHTAIAIGADGLPIISYQRTTADPSSTLKVVHCDDLACAAGGETFSMPDATPSAVGSYTSIALGSDGLAVVAYFDATFGKVRVAHCTDIPCTAAGVNSFGAANPANQVGRHLSLTIGADGMPIISFINVDQFAVSVTRCNNVFCSSTSAAASAEALDLAQNTSDTAIAIGRDGLPLVAYRNQQTFALMLLRCSKVECTAAQVTVLEDTASVLGEDLAMTIGSDGLPIISYFDETAGALRVFHCGNEICVPHFRRR
jgi:hypothetical protein